MKTTNTIQKVWNFLTGEDDFTEHLAVVQASREQVKAIQAILERSKELMLQLDRTNAGYEVVKSLQGR